MALPGQASAPSWNHHDLDHSTPFRTGSQYRLSETEPAARLALVKEAVSRFKKTTDIEDGNWYFWYRYGEALLTVATLDPAEREAKNVEARTAYCRSIATNKSDPGYIVAAQMNLRKIGLECKTN